MAKAKSKIDPVVQPMIRVAGEEHPLEILFDGPDAPEMKSIGYAQLSPGKWVSYVMTSKGREVLKVEVSEPDQRAVAEETSKIAFVEQFVDQFA